MSANPTGPLHVGTGRGAALGDSLARVLQWAGYRVDRATAPAGPFTTIADPDATTLLGPRSATVVNLYRSEGRYVLVDVPIGAADHRWFYRVTAHGPGGDGPPSAVVCGTPPGFSCSAGS